MLRSIPLASMVVLGITGSAFAADLPSRRLPVAPIPIISPYSWNGFYIGGQVGYAIGQDTVSIFNLATTGPITGYHSVPHGILGGLHAGYNDAIGGPVVAGIEADIDGSDYHHAVTSTTLTAKLSRPIGGSLRARLGYAADRTLFYVTGGAALAEFRDSYTSGVNSISASTARLGYTAGLGVEYAFSDCWSVRAEARYSSYGIINDTVLPTGISVRHTEAVEQAQIGLSYKFSSYNPPLVVARY